MNKKHLLSLSLTLIIVMLFSALGPTTVYADDGVPPDTATAEAPQTDGEPVDGGETGAQTDDVATEETTAEPPVDEVVATEEATAEPPVDEPVATEEVATEPPAVEASADEAATEEPSLIEQLPDNTDIVVINAEGETEPLATEEAAAIIITGDPIWCPDGVAPQAGANGCSDPGAGNVNYDPTSLASLLSYLAVWQPDANGTIWIEDSYDSSVNDSASTGFTFDYGSNTNYNLTIQGGWDGNSGSTAITGTSSFDVPIVIGSETNPWLGSVTIKNIVISGVVNDTGLSVYSGGSVTIENSEFTNNDVAGVYIDADKDVTVRKSKVDDNGSNDWNVVDGKGLEIKSGGYVTLRDITANDNQIFGADVQSVDGVSVADSTFNGNLMYTTNWAEFFGYGLTVVSQGDIALAGVEANENFLWGASLTGPNVYIEDSFFNKNVSDSTSFIDDTGLIIVSDDEVALRNIEANENRLIGANIQAGGQIDIRDSTFNSNFGTTEDASGTETYWGYGLQAISQNGFINLNVVEANGNYLFGANLETGSNVNITGSSFSNNKPPGDQSDWGLNNKPVINDIELDLTPQGGLMIQSGGFVTLNTVTANDNGTFGADIVADGSISVENSIFGNNLNGSGLSATSSNGDIYLDNVTALGNAQDGVYAEGLCVYLTDGTFTNNGQYGLNAPNGQVDVSGTQTYSGNVAGPTNPNVFNPCSSGTNGGGNGTGGGTTGGGGVGAGTYDDTDVAWVYSSGWLTQTAAPGAYGGSFHYSTTPGSNATFAFTGQQFTLYYTGASNRGVLNVYLDGASTPTWTINQNTATVLWQQTWISPLLTPGNHTLKFEFASGILGEIDGITIQ